MTNIIREDVVSIGFDIDLQEINKLKKELDDLKKKLMGGVGDDAFDGMGDSANDAKDDIEKLTKENKELREEIEKLKQSAGGLNDKLTTLGKKGAVLAFNGLKKIAGISFKALLTSVTAIGTGIGVIAKKSLDAFADYQQLKGGVETLFGAKGAQSVEEYAKYTGKAVSEVQKEYDTLIKAQENVLKNADNAWWTTGLSANDYMSTVTTFSASLIKSLDGDTTKAAELSDIALRDMADNANKMGTDISMIQSAYSGIARGNYMMLDNLKLGYAGSKTELERLLSDAEKIKKEMGEDVDYDIDSYADVIEAIHTIQENMGITGTTEKEAAETVTGSLNAMKASWQNLLIAMGSGEKLDECMDNMIKSAETFANNAIPVVQRALEGMGTLVEKVAPIIADKLPDLAEQLLPPLIKSAVSLVQGLIKALPNIVKTLATTIVDIFGEQFPIIKKIGDFFADNANKIGKFIPVLAGIAAAFVAFGKVKSIASVFSGLFGKGGGAGGKSGKGGIGGFFESLAKMKATTILKGMANLAIIMGGFALLGGVMAFVAPFLAEITDFKSLIEAFGVLTILAVEGMIMTKAVEPLAKMKATTVLKGIANLSIVLGGFSLLSGALAIIAPLLTELADFKALVELFGAFTLVAIEGAIMSKVVEPLAKMKVTSVLKGIANIAIVLGGFSAFAAALLAISPYIAAIGDTKSLLKLLGIITVLGLVGTALTIFAGIAGLIPVITVSLGLANMAIMIAGMSALFLLLGATTLLDFDYKRVLALVGILGVLGAVGTALTVFAGIAGVIPTGVVLKGLVNIALIMGGMTALIIAFGALSKVEGIEEFINSGGELLAKLFGVIGKIAGSLIGGIGEAVSKSLPVIGDNLAKFGTNIKPLFEAFNGVDMGGVGSFFSALGGFLLQVTGNNILDKLTKWATGGNSLEQVGKDLTSLANGAEGFFKKVAQFPENSFTNAVKLFESLSKMGGLPNSGGVKGWFGGNIDYTAIANGLKAFGSDGVTKFFAMVAEIAPETFDKTTQLFESLSNMGGLPNSGGVKGWFAGDVDYSAVADGLTKLGGDGVKKFFTMAGELSPKAFENTKLLFNSLSKMSESLPKEDNWWDKLWGNESVSLGDIAADLGTFAQKSASFFKMVNSLNLSNMNGMWESLKRGQGLTADISTKIDDNIADIVSKISKLPKKMGDAMKKGGGALADSFVEVWKEAVKASVAPVNKLLSGANHILKEFGSKKSVIEWQPYAKGTDGHKGGNALVNDGRGAELVQMPNGNAFIPKGRNVLIPNAPQGMKVLSAENTAQLLGKSSPTFNYAKGIGKLDVWSYYDNAQGLVDKITDNISYKGMSGVTSSLGESMVSTFAGEMPAWIDKLFEECGQSIASYVSSKGVTQWLPTVVRALRLEGQYSIANVARTLYQMKTESGGNPKAINLWDSNAKKGTPSKGLMQVIDPTFNAYAKSGFNKDIYDPLSNVLASVRYAVSRYGSLAKAYRGVGYANGGFADSPSIFGEDGLEAAIPLSKEKRKRGLSLWAQTGEMLGVTYTPETTSGNNYTSSRVEYNTYAPQITITVEGGSDERSLTRKITRAVQQAIADVIDEAERSSPQVREV